MDLCLSTFLEDYSWAWIFARNCGEGSIRYRNEQEMELYSGHTRLNYPQGQLGVKSACVLIHPQWAPCHQGLEVTICWPGITKDELMLLPVSPATFLFLGLHAI